jgi:hypothetical protein
LPALVLSLSKDILERSKKTLQPAFAKASAGTASSQGRCLLLSLTKYQGEREDNFLIKSFGLTNVIVKSSCFLVKEVVILCATTKL